MKASSQNRATRGALLALIAATVLGSAETRSAPVARLSDGHPDLNGTWDNGSGIDFLHPQHLEGGSVCVAGCPPAPSAQARKVSNAPTHAGRPAPNKPKYRPEYAQKVQELDKHQVERDPVLRCQNPGLPRIGPPDKIVQIPGQLVFLYDDVSGNFFRIIPTDGRPHRTDVEESALGDSIGHWEGDTLVVEATQFNDQTWLTDNGAFHSNALKVIERLHRTGDTIEYQAVAYDPKVLIEPWKTTPRVLHLTSVELVEAAPCVDQDLKHLVDDTHHDNPR